RLGTLPSAPLVGLDAALGLHFEAGPVWVEARVLANAARLADGLDRLGLRRFGTADPDRASGIVTVEHPEPEALHAHLAARNVHASLRDRKLRFAPHAYNTDDEVDAALEGVAAFGKVSVPTG